MTLQKVFPILFLSLALGACSFDDDARNSTDGRDLREYNELSEQLQPVVGVWAGTLTVGTVPHNVQLVIEIQPDNTSRNQDGQLVPRPQPVGRLYSTDENLYETTFVGRFFRSTGGLIFEKRSDGAPGGQPTIEPLKNMDLKVQGSVITGNVYSPTGFIGVLNVTLQAGQTAPPPEGEENRRNEILRAQYAQVTGKYKSTVLKPGGGRPAFSILLTVFIEDQRNANGTTTPVLRAVHTRSTDPNGDYTRLTLTGTLDTRTARPGIRFSSPAATPTGKYTVSISGYFRLKPDGRPDYNVFDAEQQSNLGVDGQMVVTREGGSAAPTPSPGTDPSPVEQDLGATEGQPLPRYPENCEFKYPPKKKGSKRVPLPDDSCVPMPFPREN